MNYYKNLSLEDLENEIWIDALGFDGIYLVSNYGRIKSLSRYVNNGKGQRLIKERIRAQTLSKDGRLTCPFSINNKTYSNNVSQLIYLSFNYNTKLNIKTHCVMHKNKNQSDNRLENLKIETISKSHSVNFEKGLLEHLRNNNIKRTENYNLLKSRVCKVCNKEKEINKFKRGYKTCSNCSYIKKSNPNYRQKTEIKIKCIANNVILNFKNTIDLEKSGIITRATFRKLLKSNKFNFKSRKTHNNYEIISIK